MTTGRSAPAEIVKPNSHLNGKRALGAAEPVAPALDVAVLVTAGAQLASASAAAPFRRVLRPSVLVIVRLPTSAVSHSEAGSLVARQCAARRGRSRAIARLRSLRLERGAYLGREITRPCLGH